MNLFDLRNLNLEQEVPKILFRPINVRENYIFFEKLVGTLDDTWCDGIWSYDILLHEMNRVDAGHHVKYNDFYDLDTPDIALDGTTKLNKESIFFVTITEIDEDNFLEFFHLDLNLGIQKRILGFKYDKENLIYKSMEILDNNFLMFRLTRDLYDISINNSDEVYIIDVKERKYYRVDDDYFYLNIGRIIPFYSKQEKYLFIEEIFIDEDDKDNILHIPDVEYEFETITDIDKENIFRNSIKIIKFDDFIAQIKSGEKQFNFDVKDEISKDGSIKIIGETEDAIYYEKEYYENYLKSKGDFISLRNIGSSEIYKFDKDTLENSFVKNIFQNDEAKTNKDRCYVISNLSKQVKILDLDTDEILYVANENMLDLYNIVEMITDDLLVLVDKNEEIEENCYILDINNNEIIAKGRDILLLDEYIFLG